MLAIAGAGALLVPLSPFAQPQQRTFRIGMLAAGSRTRFTDAIFTTLPSACWGLDNTAPTGDSYIRAPTADAWIQNTVSNYGIRAVIEVVEVVGRLCSVLGDDPHRFILDRDVFRFSGSEHEAVAIALERDSAGTSTGDRATLLLVDAIRGHTLVRADGGVLPNQITGTLPATGEYLVVVGEQPLIARGARFRGAYCVSLESSGGARGTLAPHAWVE